ncbi:MAG TPA: septal ring lytic transglycosylase RlpA family protein [bacterium]|nr:septal ring lytic transglycosylase RlpA family protein [Candidatus Omnitrophota bacterium]HOJ60405.1 septal ring lytic transglycosylase RlpA family protein [bacterium]HOL94253.1 septal ring lytic transglycosylase RlpA family protein [bacterium]HPP02592.1 septal ring lytic transglycosylase RlpA family protein [bacterium]
MGTANRTIDRVRCLLWVIGLTVTVTGCTNTHLVRIPRPIPTFGLGGAKIAKRVAPPAALPAPPVSQFSNPSVPPPPGEPKEELVGLATYYGPEFHGRRTASGERFNMYAMTAAHRTLPFNTTVRITNLENDKVAYVRINDRGPYHKGRIIDLSRAAARELEFEHKGTARVRVEIF